MKSLTLAKRLLGLAALLLLWQVTASLLSSPMICRLDQIGAAALTSLRSGVLLRDAGISLERVSLGFLVAALFGITAAVLMHRYAWLRGLLSPVVDAVRPVAALTLFPLIILTLGLGEASKVFVIFWTAWPACLLNTLQGLDEVEKEVIEAAQLDGAGAWRIILDVTIPLSLSTLMTGLRIGLSGGWISLVAAEMLGANSGLGFSVLYYSNSFQFPEMYASIFTIAGVGLLMNLALARAQSLLTFNGGTHESNFLVFGDRAAGWFSGSLRTLSSTAHRGGLAKDDPAVR